MEKRTVVLDSVHKKAVDQKYNATLYLKTQQEVMSFYEHFGFQLEQFNRAKDQHTDNAVLYVNKEPVVINNHVNVDETILLFVRDESQANLAFEDEIFGLFQTIEKGKQAVHDKYDFKLIFAVIAVICSFGMFFPLYTIPNKKKKAELALLQNRYNETMEKVNAYTAPVVADKVEKPISEKDAGDLNDALRKLQTLFQDGLITQEEYDAKKKKLLDI